VIGHEITHGFDDEGRQYDENGILRDWWTANVARAFSSKAQCVIDLYNSYEVLPGLFINGKLTEGENLADLGGLRISYQAYKQWIEDNGEHYSNAQFEKYFPGYTTDQLFFFISFGQLWCGKATDNYLSYLTKTNPHSWNKFRVLGGVSNFPEFSQAFQCLAHLT